MKKILMLLVGLVMGNLIALIIHLLTKNPDIGTFWGSYMVWFKYHLIIDIIETMIFILIIVNLGKLFKFQLILPQTNFLILGLVYAFLLNNALSQNFLVSINRLLEKIKIVDMLITKSSIFVSFLFFFQVIFIPFLIFTGIILTYNYILKHLRNIK